MPTAQKLGHTVATTNGPRAYLAALMAELDRAAISLRLHDSLEKSGMTQQEAADYLHVHKRTVEDYVSSKKATVPFDRLEEWAAMTGVRKEWLLHGDVAWESPSEERWAKLEAEMTRLADAFEIMLEQGLPAKKVRAR